LERPEGALAEFSRVLRPEGVLLFGVYTPNDSACGGGEQIGPLEYIDKGTLRRFFTPDMVNHPMRAWKGISIRRYLWLDPPHGSLRPEPHMHDCWLVRAFKAK